MAGDPTVQPTAFTNQEAAAAQQQQTAQQKADASAAWLAQEHPTWNQPAGSAAEAARINAAYLSNTLPVVPRMAVPLSATPGSENDLTRVYIGGTSEVQGTPMDLTRSQYIAMYGRTPERSEAAKYQEFNAPINFAAYANVPLSQMPANVASRVQDYYAAHPSARARAITSQYSTQHGVISNPYDKDSAAGIAWEVQRTTGGAGNLTSSLIAEAESPVDKFGAPKASYTPYGAYEYSGISTVPIRDLSTQGTAPLRITGTKEMAAFPQTMTELTPGGGVIGFVPEGRIGKTAIPDVKFALEQKTGEIAIYKYSERFGTWDLLGGGGRAAAQSGRFTFADVTGGGARTPVVYEWGSAGTKLSETWADKAQAAQVLAHPELYSRTGAEVTGGVGGILLKSVDISGIATGKVQQGTYSDIYNLGHYADPFGVNLGKSQAPGADIPWSIAPGSPTIQYMSPKGLTGEVAYNTGAGRLVGGNVIAGIPTIQMSSMSQTQYMTTQVSPMEAAQQTQIETARMPSQFGFAVISSPFVPSEMKSIVTEFGDVVLGGKGPFAMTAGAVAGVAGLGGDYFQRYDIITETGPARAMPSKVTVGEPISEYRDLGGGSYSITTMTPVTTTGGTVTPVTMKYVPVSGGFDILESKAQQFTAGIPELTYRETGNVPLNYLEAGGIGLVMGIKHHPAEAAVWAAGGVVLAAGAAGVASLGASTVAATEGMGALSTIAVGTHWFASTAAPIALTALYGADVFERSTGAKLYYGTPGEPLGLKATADLSPMAAQRFGEIAAVEAGPMLIGGGAFAYRGQIVSGVRGAYESLPSMRDIGTGVSERVYSFQQGRAGIENIGVGGGRGFDVYSEPVYAKPVEPYAFLSEAKSTYRTEPSPVAERPIIPEERAFETFVRDYSAQGYREINAKLRSGESVGFDIESAFKAYSSGKAPETIYRGVSGEYAYNLASMKIGSVISEKGILSFSSSKAQAHMFTDSGWKGPAEPGVIIKMKPAAQEPLFEVGRYANRNEMEFLMAPGEFKIRSIGKEFVGAEYTGGKYSELLGKSTVIEIERISGTGRDIYNPMDYIATGPKLIEMTKQVAVPSRFEFREFREYRVATDVGRGTVTLGQEIRYTGDIGTPARTAEFKYNIAGLEEPITMPAWTEKGRTSVTARTSTVATLDPFTGQFSAFVTKGFELAPKPKTPVAGYAGEQFGYQMNIYDIPMFIERPGKGPAPSPQISAMTRAKVTEQRLAGVVDVIAKRSVGTYGEIERGVTSGGKREVLESVKTREIGKAFEELTSAEVPVNIAMRFEKGVPRPNVIRAAQARAVAGKPVTTPVKVIDLAKVGKGAKPEGAQVLKSPEVTFAEKASSISRNIIQDIKPLHSGKQYVTPASKALAMGRARAAHIETVAQNMERFGIQPTAKAETPFWRKVTPRSQERAMTAAKEAQKATVARNKVFVGSQIADIMAGKGGRRVAETVMDTTEMRMHSEVVFRGYRKAGRVKTAMERETESMLSRAGMEDLEMRGFSGMSVPARERELAAMFSRAGAQFPYTRAATATRAAEEERQRSIMAGVTGLGEISIESQIVSPIEERDPMRDVLRATTPVTERATRQRDILDTERWQDLIPGREVIQTTRQETQQITRTGEITTYIPDYFEEWKWKKKPPAEPFGGVGYGGGGGAWPSWTERTRKRTYRNPVVDIEYLTGLAGAGSNRDIISQFNR